jgi:hypothetical protein
MSIFLLIFAPSYWIDLNLDKNESAKHSRGPSEILRVAHQLDCEKVEDKVP